ncbi:MAG: aminoglycoside phosphotransferase family protein [Parachlamydiales bacterium]|nr:aminoglycoside phosphotransferase family protein [Parachlamydiales bacterium]
MTEITQIIINCLKTCYLIEAALLHLLPLGADMNASVYKVESSNRTSYFVKVRKGHPDDAALTILELLQSAGIQEIIFPIKTIEGSLTQRFGDYTFIVYPFIEGQDGFVRSLNERQWIQFGKILKQIHEIKVPQPLQKRIRREDFSPKWRDAVRSIYVQIENIQIKDETAKKIKKLLTEHKATIEQLVNRAEELSQKIQKKPLQFVLCHSDIHGGNILLSDNDAFHIVDWDDPIMAPKERDLMFIGGGVGNVWNEPHEEKLFYEGYGNGVVDKTILAYYRLERIVEDIAIYAQELLLNRENNIDREQMYKHFVDMFKPRGVIDISLLN